MTPPGRHSAFEHLSIEPQSTVDRVAEILATEGTPLDDHRASAAYRSAMLGQSLRKLYAESAREARP